MTYRLKEKLAIGRTMGNGMPITLGFDKDTVIAGDLLENLLQSAEIDGLVAAGVMEPVANIAISKVLP